MKQEDLLTLYDYNYWANDLILRTAAQLSPEQYTALVEVSHGSLRGTLVHQFGGELIWRLRCQEGVSPLALPDEEEIASFDLLVQRWKEEEANMRAYLASLQDSDLTKSESWHPTPGRSGRRSDGVWLFPRRYRPASVLSLRKGVGKWAAPYYPGNFSSQA
jgi:uncharacterized damage-inducible protein DinB